MDYEPFIEAAVSALRIGAIILPLLIIIDFFNHKYGEKIEEIIKKSHKLMPFFGASLGLLPGCNVAVVSAVLYTEKIATLGTLVATLIATSDEALYVFIPLGFNFIPLMIVKFIIAIIAGYIIDFFPRKFFGGKAKNIEIDFCCAQHHHPHGFKGKLKHAFEHTVRVVLIVFIVLSALNYTQDAIGAETLERFFDFFGYFQPVITAVVGLFPGCGTSVAIATLYTQNVITFGAAVAGLSTASGEALIVMSARGVDKKVILKIILILLFFGTLGGLAVQALL